MAIHYRLLLMNRDTGRVERAREFQAYDDEAASEIAERLQNGGPMELWSGPRKIRRWEAKPEKPSWK